MKTILDIARENLAFAEVRERDARTNFERAKPRDRKFFARAIADTEAQVRYARARVEELESG